MTDQLPFFVYGTLRPGQHNYSLMKGGVAEQTPAVLADHAMYASGLPYVVAEHGGIVMGDLVTVTEDAYAEMLDRLDRLEGYREGRDEDSFYIRRQVEVTTDLGPAQAWVYLAGANTRRNLVRDRVPRVEGGDWTTVSVRPQAVSYAS